jgi:hypothetical protein
MERAGFNSAQLRLRQAGLDALRKHHRNIGRAVPTLEIVVEDDPELIGELVLNYLCGLDAEANGGGRPCTGDQTSGAAARNGAGQAFDAHPTGSARPVREPSASDRAAASRVAAQIAVTIFDRAKTADGRPWGNVGAHELDGMDRDGALARAVKARLGQLSNRQRFQTLRELMAPDAFEACVDELREQSHDA